MINPSDHLVGLDGQLLEIDIGLPSPLLGEGRTDLLDESDFAGIPVIEILSNMARPRLSDPDLVKHNLTLIHRHFLDPLVLDVWPFAHYYDYRDFMQQVRVICLSVSKIRLAGMDVSSGPDHPGFLTIRRGDNLVEPILVDGRSGGSQASMLLRTESLSRVLLDACDRLCIP